jgi:D-alanyl-D-alanine carboxypeptidase
MSRSALWAIPLAALVLTAQTPYDALLAPRFAGDQAGASVLVMKEGKVLFAQGYGLANRELKVPNRPEYVYRIGSVTKQFTAAAVMTLVEAGKVQLDAPIGTYLPDLPEAWRPATVRQLLQHTSGIPSYTDGPEYGAHMREDLSGMTLLTTLVGSKPLDFAPGTQWRYNNSGYFLLGMLVEKVSGQPYATYLQTRFFGPLGLAHTRYGTETDFIPGMVAGYGPGGKPAAYLSMTQPYAAGSLVSTAEDLARWTLALHAGQVVKPESLKLMTTPARTADGQEHPYGFGLAFRTSQGRRLVGHGGGINGFVCQVEADPEAKTVAVVLCNTVDPGAAPEFLTRRLLALAAGTPLPEPVAVPMAPDQLQRFVGTYELEGRRRTITLDQGRLWSRVGNRRAELIPTGDLSFAIKDGDTRLRFVAEGNRVVGVHRQPEGAAEEPLARRVAEAARTAVPQAPQVLDALVGTYRLAPSFELKVWREGDKLLSQATGQGPIELFAESATRWFPKVIDATLTFELGPEGKAKALVLEQGGRRMPAPRVD